MIEDANRILIVEDALLESEQRYRRLLAYITDYICSVQIGVGQPVPTSHGPGCLA